MRHIQACIQTFRAQMCWDSKYFEAIIYCLAIRIDSFCNLSLRLTSYLIIYKIMCVCKQPPSCHFKTLRSMWIEWALDINLCNINGHKKCKNVSNRKPNQTMKVFFLCWMLKLWASIHTQILSHTTKYWMFESNHDTWRQRIFQLLVSLLC